jgi:pyridoxine 4-dehydrogenase
MTHPLTGDRTSLTLPKMGCGTWAWGNRLLWGYDSTMDRELQQVFNLAVKNDVTLFDTGDSYGTGKLNGRSEQLLGQFYRAYLGQNKEKICLATKLAAYPWRLTPNAMTRACQQSEQRLGRPVDLVQLHWSTANYFPWQETQLIKGLIQLYQRHQVKAIGLSNFGPKRLKQVHRWLADEGVAIATLQVQYSLLSTYPVTKLGLKETCDELGIQLIAYSPLALGLLTGKYRDRAHLPRGLRGILFRQLLPSIHPLIDCLDEIARQNNKTLSQISLNWCMRKGTIPIPGAKSAKQMENNLGAMGWQLEEGALIELDKTSATLNKKMVQNIFQSH